MIRADFLRLPLIAIAAAMLAVPAQAQDSRLKTRVYDEAEVYQIDGRVKVQTTIKFREDEAIENVAIGDSEAWQVQPNRAQSLLFVKPLAPTARTNMTVVTSKRTYLFDLVASPRSAPLYVLRFSYPQEERAEREAQLAREAAAAQEQASPVEIAAANDPFAVADPDNLNFAWSSEGDRGLIPARMFDDGEVMFLTWPEGASIPAILITNEKGDEGPVNTTVRGNTVVLDMVPRTIVLRSGSESAVLTNNGPARPTALSYGEPK